MGFGQGLGNSIYFYLLIFLISDFADYTKIAGFDRNQYLMMSLLVGIHININNKERAKIWRRVRAEEFEVLRI